MTREYSSSTSRLADLDPIAAGGIDALILQLNRILGITVVIFTHDLATLFTVCGRIAVLVDKAIIVGTADKLMKSSHPWIHEFFHGPRAEVALKARKTHHEADKHYFFEGLFIIAFAVAAAIFAVWLGSAGHRDDVIYRIRFPDSVSGLTAGDTVKFRGVDVGTVKSMGIDPDNSRLVRVDVKLRKETPVKTDTRASLTLKGITGVVFVEFNGGDPAAKTLVAVTPENQIPEIPSEKTGLSALLDDLPKLVKKFSSSEDQVKKVVTSVGGLTDKVTENPSLLLRRPEKK